MDMPTTNRRTALAWTLGLCCAGATGGAGAAEASGYPARTVRIITPFSAGGGSDLVARLLAERFAARFGKPFVVENKTGAGGLIGTTAAITAAPDGCTLLVVSSSYAVSAAVSTLSFDPVADIAPVSHVANAPLMIAVAPSVPARTLAELDAYVAANPGKLSYGSPGVGTVTHLAAEHWLQSTGLHAVHVPYQGMMPAINATIAGDVQIVFSDAGAISALVKSGRVRPIVVGGSRRLDQLPDVPTAAEAGQAGLMLDTWYAMLAPKNTPPEVLALLNAQTDAVLQTKEASDILKNRFMTPVGGSAAPFTELLRKEIGAWKTLVAQRGITVQ